MNQDIENIICEEISREEDIQNMLCEEIPCEEDIQNIFYILTSRVLGACPHLGPLEEY